MFPNFGTFLLVSENNSHFLSLKGGSGKPLSLIQRPRVDLAW